MAATLHRRDREGARQGRLKNLAIITPGFSADCLETIEEIGAENAEFFHENGGVMPRIPCLNDSDEGMDAIRQLVMRELQGWICMPAMGSSLRWACREEDSWSDCLRLQRAPAGMCGTEVCRRA